MKTRVSSVILVALLALPSGLAAQTSLPDTPEGTTVKEYLRVFNLGDDAETKKYLQAHISREGLAVRPVQNRIEQINMFRGDVKSLTLEKVVGVDAHEISVLVKDGRNEPLTMHFQFDENPEHTLKGIRIERGSKESGPAGPPLTRAQFDSTVTGFLNGEVSNDHFSGAVLLQRGSGVLLKKAWGEADREHHLPNATDTKFNIGSITKYFTRVAVTQLMEKEKLALGDRVGKILPDYPNRAVREKVTIAHLLTMQSGMGDFFGDAFDKADKSRIRSLKDYLPFFVNDSLLFEPGTNRRYSNAGFILLGLIVEKLSGEDYYAYVKKQIYDPAGMVNSDWYPVAEATPNRATGYYRPDKKDAPRMPNSGILPGRGSSAGGSYSTLDDLKLFVDALLNAKLLSPKFSQWVVTGNLPATDPPVPLTQGSLGIAGGAQGVNASLEFDAATGDVVVVLSNYDPPSAEATGRALSGYLRRLK